MFFFLSLSSQAHLMLTRETHTTSQLSLARDVQTISFDWFVHYLLVMCLLLAIGC